MKCPSFPLADSSHNYYDDVERRTPHDHPPQVRRAAQSAGPLCGRARAAAGEPRLRSGLHRPHDLHRLDRGEGWHDAKLQPYGPLVLDPATSVFHYAQELFEGLKAYRQPNGSIVAFRPYANAARFNQSAQRMAMPELPEETFVESLELLVQTDRDWVPTAEGHSLYLRPFMIATQQALGVNHPSRNYKYMVIASPAASYFTGGLKPVSVWLSTEYTRAAPGGTGFAKCGGNYAAAFVAQRQAVEEGCDQVVWLDAFEHRWVEEMGGMNLFFVFGDRLVTPALTGTLLPGITRDSILSLAERAGIQGGGGQDLHRGVAGGLRVRRAHRGLRLRHRRRRHPRRLRQGRRPELDRRRRHARSGHDEDPRGARGHPVRQPPRHPPLDPQDLLTVAAPARLSPGGGRCAVGTCAGQG